MNTRSSEEWVTCPRPHPQLLTGFQNKMWLNSKQLFLFNCNIFGADLILTWYFSHVSTVLSGSFIPSQAHNSLFSHCWVELQNQETCYDLGALGRQSWEYRKEQSRKKTGIFLNLATRWLILDNSLSYQNTKELLSSKKLNGRFWLRSTRR